MSVEEKLKMQRSHWKAISVEAMAKVNSRGSKGRIYSRVGLPGTQSVKSGEENWFRKCKEGSKSEFDFSVL